MRGSAISPFSATLLTYGALAFLAVLLLAGW